MGICYRQKVFCFNTPTTLYFLQGIVGHILIWGKNLIFRLIKKGLVLDEIRLFVIIGGVPIPRLKWDGEISLILPIRWLKPPGGDF